LFKDNKNTKVGTIITRWLFIVIFVALLISLFSIIVVQSIYQRMYAMDLIAEGVADVSTDIDETFSSVLRDYTIDFADMIEDNRNYITDDSWLKDLVDMNSDFLSEINIVDNQGYIVNSSIPEYVGWDMASGEKSREFMCLLDGADYYDQGLRENSYDENMEMVYAGAAFSDESGFLEIGVSKKNYDNYLLECMSDEVRNRRIGIDGVYAIADKNYKIIGSTNDAFNGHTIEKTELLADKEDEPKFSRVRMFDTDCYVVSIRRNNYYYIGGFPVSEAGRFGRLDKILIISMNILMLLCIFIILSRLLNKHVVKGIEDINASLSKITHGDLDERAEVKNSIEFTELSDGINSTVDRLKQMIAEADARIDEELAMANSIQQASLPDCTDEYRDNDAFSLYARMETAKTVGGDFFDFYKISDHLLVVTMADVSDKGIPAAMFMMRAKAVLKRLAEEGRSVEDMASAANSELWENNEGSMFVTVWIGFIDLDTGRVQYVHAGHTCPVIFGMSEPVFVKQKRELMMGAMPEVIYHRQEFTLQPGESLFLYTDGVTEAEGEGDTLYGNDRLLSFLAKKHNTYRNSSRRDYCKEICCSVTENVHAFSGDIPQSDDITVLCVRYNKGK
jgi:serine phosphatase RsbU (regulator of sigma subunit)